MPMDFDDELKCEISEKMRDIHEMLPEGYNLTLVCRHVTDDPAKFHYVASDDDIKLAAAVLVVMRPNAGVVDSIPPENN
jgi:hypothetical protein